MRGSSWPIHRESSPWLRCPRTDGDPQSPTGRGMRSSRTSETISASPGTRRPLKSPPAARKGHAARPVRRRRLLCRGVRQRHEGRGTHEGAYTPFTSTSPIASRPGANELVVRVIDPPPTPPGGPPRFPDMPYEELPRGKQNWYIQNGGLWQPVWLEIRAGAVHRASAGDGEDERRHRDRRRDCRQPARSSRDAEDGRARPGRKDRGVACGYPGVDRRERSRSRGQSRRHVSGRRQDPALYTVEVSLAGSSRDRAVDSVRLPRVHRARRPVLSERAAFLHAGRARPGLLRRLDLLDARQGVLSWT